MALDLHALRTAATREQRERDKAHGGLAAALLAGEAARERSASKAERLRAERKITTAAGKLANVPDRISELLLKASPDEVLGALERDVPLVLLPVRLETRFMRRPRAWDLAVRVFPDAIHGDAHERELTKDEQRAGTDFWARPASERETAWQELSALLGPRRAAWVAEAMRTQYLLSTAAVRFTRPAWTEALPDRFLFLVTADGAALPPFEGERVRSPLATGPDPRLAPDADDGADAGMRWMTDFTTAVAEGMGARVPLGAALPERIDQVLVFGVRASAAPAATATLLGRLLDAHRYADGLEVMKVGTPTNAGAGESPGGPGPRPERTPVTGGHAIAAGADGARLARALGVAPGRLAGVAGADATADTDAQAMLTALWPGTLGYFLAQMLAGSVSPEEATLLRAHAVNWVRGRGPFAPLRVGRQPYGVLPATSLARYAPDPADPPEAARLLALLRALLPAWAEAADKVPKAGRGPAAQASTTLAQILGLAPVSVEVDARRVYPEGVVDILTGLGGMSGDEQASMRTISGKLIGDGLSSIGALKEKDELQRIVGAADTTRVRIARVQTAPLSETLPLAQDYLTFLRTAAVDEIAAAEERYGAPLLYLLARHALLQQYVRAAAQPSGPGRSAVDILDKAVIVDLPGVDKPQVAVDLLLSGGPKPGGGGGPPMGGGGPPFGGGGPQMLPMGQMVKEGAGALAAHVSMGGGGFEQPLVEVRSTGTAAVRVTGTAAQRRRLATAAKDPGTSETAQVLAALAHLAPLPSAALDRLLRETFDLASHRLDAWVTSLATKRLAQMRAAKPNGAHLGAYGVVRDLVPEEAKPPSVKPPGSPAGTAEARDADNQGFLHAPSLGHAATAAVLRSAHAAHGDDEAFAVSLDSARVRRALALQEGVRQGQPLAALLGYQLERGLLDRGAPTAIAKLRDAAPLRTSTVAPAPGTPFETVAPRDVVDGLALARGTVALPALTQAEAGHVNAVLADVRDALDATGDLLLAEGVHQLVAGTAARAAAATRAAAGVAPPPDRLDVITTPRSGTALTHRVLLVSDRGAGWTPPGSETPRVLADPLLEGWAAGLLGPRDGYGALVAFAWRDAKDVARSATLEVRLEDLGIGALDAVAMSTAPAHGQRCELERRVLDRACSAPIRPPAVPVGAEARIASRAGHVAASNRIPLADLVVAASALSELLRVARAPAPHELDPSLPLDAGGLDAGELSKRLSPLRQGVGDAAARLAGLLKGVDDEKVDLEQLLDALRAASLLVSAALPEAADPAGTGAREVLVPQARGVWDELERRGRVADELIAARSLGTGTAGSIEQRRDVAEVLLDGAPPMAPVLEATLAATVRAGVDAPPSLGAGVASAGAKASVIRAFLARARRVRRGVARLDGAEALAVALGGAPLTLRVTQTGTAGAPWVALPQAEVPGGVTSLVLAGDADFAPATPVAVLVLDDWTEAVPRAQEVTALAVHTDRPGNDAPQAVLVAVPPDPAQAWSVASLQAVLDETLALAEVRMVDPPALSRFGHLLPALLLACTGRQGQIKVPEKWFFPRKGR